MKVLHILPNFELKLGGVPKVVFEMTKSLTQKGVDITLVSSADESNAGKIFNAKDISIHICKRGILSHYWTGYSSDAYRVLRKEAKNCDLIHIHELWHYLHYIGYKVARELKKPYGVSIHGELSSWCLNYKKLRKNIYSKFFQKKALKEANFLHAITKEEAKDSLSYSGNNNIFTIPNGIEIDKEDSCNIADSFSEFDNKKVIFFLGRIDPKKGLDLLARAWGRIAKNRDDLILVIAGPDTSGYKDKILYILKNEGVIDKVIFVGLIEGQNKVNIFKRAEMVVIPSYSEVRTLVALEAMAYGKPIIITDKCHFPEVEELEAGIVIKPEVEDLVNAVNKLLINPQLGEQMGKNGKELILDKYTWGKISDQIIEMYNSVLSEKLSKDICQNV